MIGDWSHDFAYLEGFFSFRGEFLGFVLLQLFFTLNYYDISFTHRSNLIALDSPYDILTVLSVSSTVDFLLIDYFSHNYSS